jgi:hypothetical protein
MGGGKLSFNNINLQCLHNSLYLYKLQGGKIGLSFLNGYWYEGLSESNVQGKIILIWYKLERFNKNKYIGGSYSVWQLLRLTGSNQPFNQQSRSKHLKNPTYPV